MQCGFTPGFVNYKKGHIRLAAASDKVYQLLDHGRWFFWVLRLCSFSLPYEILRPLMTILFNINYTNMVSKGATHIISFNILFQNERHTNYINVSQTKDILNSLNKGNIVMKQLCI
jgi:hypothetical protein